MERDARRRRRRTSSEEEEEEEEDVKPQRTKKQQSSRGGALSVRNSLILLVLAIVVPPLLVCIVPLRIKPVVIDLQPPPRPRELPVKYQSISAAIIYLRNKVIGPDSLHVSNNHVYSGLADGRIVRMKNFLNDKAEVETVTRLRRPLGLREHPQTGELLVADSYMGLIAVNTENGATRRLIPERSRAAPYYMLDDLDITPDGRHIYFTDMGRFPYHELYLSLLEGSDSGRLLCLDIKSGEVQTLLNGKGMNGIQLHRDGKSLLVAETLQFRVLRYYFKGDRAGKHEIFADNLPGAPDNIRLSPQGGYWIGFTATRLQDKYHYNFFDRASQWPVWRRFLYFVPMQLTMGKMLTMDGSAVRLDEQGRIVQLLRDATGRTVRHITQVTELTNGTLLLGNFYLPFTQRIDKKQIV